MRRDYFLCVFLLCLCVSLFFVCFTPLYFLYGEIVPRDFGGFETFMSWLYTVMVFIFLPIYAAWRKKPWMTIGLASYSFVVACLPAWILPGMADKLVGDDANIVTVAFGGLLKEAYSTAAAPFGPVSKALGDDFAESLPRKILPVVVIVYLVVKLFRFYKAAYLAEQVTPMSALDATVKENNIQGLTGVRASQTLPPEILGTVISAPVAANPTTVPSVPPQRPTAPVAAPVATAAPAPVAMPVAQPVASTPVALPPQQPTQPVALPPQQPSAAPVALPVNQKPAGTVDNPILLPGNVVNNVATAPKPSDMPPDNP